MSRLLTCLFLLSAVTACRNPMYSDPPLHEAAMYGELSEVKKLVKEGVSVNSTNREGATPLHWAAVKGHVDVAKFLLKRGAKVNVKTRRGSTPLRLAEDYNNPEIAKLLKRRGARK